MEEKTQKNGWRHIIRIIHYDIAFIKETMVNLDKKISEQMIKHELLEKRVDRIDEDIRKRQFQSFYVIVGAILSFMSGLILFILSILRGRV